MILYMYTDSLLPSLPLRTLLRFDLNSIRSSSHRLRSISLHLGRLLLATRRLRIRRRIRRRVWWNGDGDAVDDGWVGRIGSGNDGESNEFRKFFLLPDRPDFRPSKLHSSEVVLAGEDLEEEDLAVVIVEEVSSLDFEKCESSHDASDFFFLFDFFF